MDVELALLIDRFMRRIHAGLQAKADGFDKENVGPGGGIVLLTLADLGCVSMNELTTRVARDKSQMSRMMQGLERKGLVDRSPSPKDARVSLVSLTPAGAEVVETLQHAVAGTINDILAPIDPKEKALLKELMQRVVE